MKQIPYDMQLWKKGKKELVNRTLSGEGTEAARKLVSRRLDAFSVISPNKKSQQIVVPFFFDEIGFHAAIDTLGMYLAAELEQTQRRAFWVEMYFYEDKNTFTLEAGAIGDHGPIRA